MSPSKSLVSKQKKREIKFDELMKGSPAWESHCDLMDNDLDNIHKELRVLKTEKFKQ